MKRYTVFLVREDGQALGIDGVEAKTETEAASRAHLFTPPMWANGQEVKHYINRKLILGKW